MGIDLDFVGKLVVDYVRDVVDIDATGRYVVPGFIDAHVHIESSKLTVDGFAEVVVPVIDYAEPYAALESDARGTYRFVDRDGDLVAIRSDFTPMVARSLAPEIVQDFTDDTESALEKAFDSFADQFETSEGGSITAGL